MSDEKKTRVIKRYTNRKLYDTADSRYVTLDEIAAMVKSGEEVQIVDNRNGEDLTEVTLAQILFEEQKKNKTRMPLGVLKDLIRTSGETITDFLQRKVAQPVQNLREEAERQVDKIVRSSETRVEETSRQVREFFASTHKSLDELQKKLDDRVQGVLTGMPGLSKQLEGLRQRFEELEQRLKRKPPTTKDGQEPPEST
ncbi:MAG TPA: polyhydroxyalkanoate synthesis regulator DNA-binding domain-containing protein [Myxococcota bacterium]|nr:polyhydroxyalkanoate synthesis regulator DNA-binding domain-containing protein [Myxococcota bacterium]HRY93462.1 polyhydroxyalkanoate synthesis regulator DNA-binding domain-containing protein [Myxococcota bacterium]HSA20309.1 polyhydroxyalkanoate synthesis regulator DNA-binding domain-containing protein [Myxococcota bacterium]